MLVNFIWRCWLDVLGGSPPLESRAPYLRRKQNEELSMQSVVKGVEKVRAGDYTPAVQHFFKALEIYDRNIEALVGRAAA